MELFFFSLYEPCVVLLYYFYDNYGVVMQYKKIWSLGLCLYMTRYNTPLTFVVDFRFVIYAIET